MKKVVLFSFLVFSIGYAQNKQVLYDFAGLPQTLMLNPGAEANNKFYMGLPLASQISVQAGFTGFSAYDIFAVDGININDKLRREANNFGKAEVITINQQLEILSAGFQLKNNAYLSFGYYQEFDFLGKIPGDMVDLFYEGNTILDKRYSIKKLTARAELLGVLHVGLSKKISDQWRIGARVKLYSGVFNAKSKNNWGSFYTESGVNNIYNHNFEDINFLVQTSGLFFEDTDEITASYIKNKLLFGGNLGLGLDLGFTYYPQKQWKITGSILDLGFVNYSKNIESYSVKGSYEIDGVSFNFDPNNPENYWQDLKDDFDANVVLDTIYNSYISIRPVKLNGSVSFGYGRPVYDNCRFFEGEDYYTNKFGFQLYSTVGAVHSQIAGTLFYERRVSKHLQTKLTYTADAYSFTNFGAGLATRLGAFNMYVTADNLLNLANLYDAKSASLQFGINFIINGNN